MPTAADKDYRNPPESMAACGRLPVWKSSLPHLNGRLSRPLATMQSFGDSITAPGSPGEEYEERLSKHCPRAASALLRRCWLGCSSSKAMSRGAQQRSDRF